MIYSAMGLKQQNRQIEVWLPGCNNPVLTWYSDNRAIIFSHNLQIVQFMNTVWLNAWLMAQRFRLTTMAALAILSCINYIQMYFFAFAIQVCKKLQYMVCIVHLANIKFGKLDNNIRMLANI